MDLNSEQPSPRIEKRRSPWPAVILALAAAAALAVAAQGPAGDEEVAHYQIARHAFEDPELLLSLQGRPLVTLALCLPARAGFLAARLASLAAVGLTAWLVIRMAGRAGWASPWVAVSALLLEPFYLAHAGTAMTEPWAAALVALGLWAFVERRPGVLATAAALLATARLELAVFLPVAAVALLLGRRRAWMLLLPCGLLAWNVGGWIASGDPLWLLHQVEPRPYPVREPLHYVKSFVWIAGLGVFAPALVGLAAAFGNAAGLLRPRKRALPPPEIRGPETAGSGDAPGDRAGEPAGPREPGDPAGEAAPAPSPGPAGTPAGSSPATRYARRVLLAAAFLTLAFFGLYTYLATYRPLTYGNLRYLAFAAAPLALLAAAGLRRLTLRTGAAAGIGLLGAVAGAAFLWGNPVHAGSDLLQAWSPLPLLAAGIWLAWTLSPVRARWSGPALLLCLGIFGLAHDHRGTLHLSRTPEQEGALTAARLLDPARLGKVPIHSAHPLLPFYAGGNPYDPAVWAPVTRRLDREAGAGEVWFWETHYTPRPGAAFDLESVAGNPTWRYLGGVVASDTAWAGAYFVKEGAAPAGTGVLLSSGMDREAWIQAARVVETGAGYALEAARADPRNPRRWQVLADRLAAAGRDREAWTALERAEALDPDGATTRTVKAFLLLRRGDLPSALEAARSARAAGGDDPYLAFLEGQILWRMGRTAEARPLVLGAVDRLPDRWDAQLLAADILYEEGSWAHARYYYLLVVGRKPDHERANLRIAASAVRLGNLDMAEERLRFLLRVRPGSARGYAALADLLVARDRAAEAERVLEEGMTRTGGDSTIAARLAELRE